MDKFSNRFISCNCTNTNYCSYNTYTCYGITKESKGNKLWKGAVFGDEGKKTTFIENQL